MTTTTMQRAPMQRTPAQDPCHASAQYTLTPYWVVLVLSSLLCPALTACIPAVPVAEASK